MLILNFRQTRSSKQTDLTYLTRISALASLEITRICAKLNFSLCKNLVGSIRFFIYYQNFKLLLCNHKISFILLWIIQILTTFHSEKCNVKVVNINSYDITVIKGSSPNFAFNTKRMFKRINYLLFPWYHTVFWWFQ